MYLTLIFGINALGVIMSVVVFKLHHNSSSIHIGSTGQTVINTIRRILCIKPHSAQATLEVKTKTELSGALRRETEQDGANDDNCTRHPEDYSRSQPMPWTVVAETLDYAVFYVISVSICVSTCVILPYISLAGTYNKMLQSDTGACDTFSRQE